MTTAAKVLPFVAPFGVFMFFLVGIDGTFPDQHYVLYPLKCLLVAAALAWYWRELPPLKPAAPVMSGVIGVAGVVIWVGLDPLAMRLDTLVADGWNGLAMRAGLGSWRMAEEPLQPGRDPFALYPAAEAWALFGLRVAGIALVVPVMEELFWRGFLMRWLIRENFTAVPLGAYQAFSFWVTTACFASVHGSEWPLAVIVGTIYGAWFVRTKSLGSIMLAHGVTNFLLALYCLASGDWHFLSTGPEAQLSK
jgi:membrane protease YdiL (CAAX protease family)